MKLFLCQLLFMGAVLVAITGCDENRVFEEYKSIPESTWNKDSLVRFDVHIDNTSQNNNLYIDVRNELTYSYSNLWLFVEIVQPNGKAVKDTVEITLALPSGEWLGKGFGGLKTYQALFRRNVYFPEAGDYKINIQQGMREENLKGISDIGFRVEKVD